MCHQIAYILVIVNFYHLVEKISIKHTITRCYLPVLHYDLGRSFLPE